MSEQQQNNQKKLNPDEIDDLWIASMSEAPVAVVRLYHHNILKVYKMVFTYGIPMASRLTNVHPVDLISAMSHLQPLEAIAIEREIDFSEPLTGEEQVIYGEYYRQFYTAIGYPDYPEGMQEDSQVESKAATNPADQLDDMITAAMQKMLRSTDTKMDA